MMRTLAAVPVAAFSFVAVLTIAAIAVSNGLLGDDALRLWAGASTAADGQVPVGRIIAAYPTLPFLASTLVAWFAPAATPAPAVVAAAILALIAVFCFVSLRKAGWPGFVAGVATLLLAFHPVLLWAVIDGTADMFLAVFLLMLCLALYDLRARSGTSEVMAVGLALMGLAFSHPMGAAFAFAAVPFLTFAVRPVLVANSALNVLVALIFPTLFTISAFTYVSWVFPGDGWSFFAAPAASLSVWTAATARMFGPWFSGLLTLAASAAMAVALVLGAPVAAVMLARVYRRRPLLVPALVFVAAAIAATAIGVASGVFGNPSAVIIAAPILATAVVLRVPVARECQGLVVSLLVLGWFGGCASVTLVDPGIVNAVRGALDRAGGERIDSLAAGGAAIGHDGMLADVDNAPVFIVGRGRVHGIFGPESEPFALAVLLDHIDTPFVAVPDPHSAVGTSDRLNKAFPTLFQQGAPGYRIIYQNSTWRLFGRVQKYANKMR